MHLPDRPPFALRARVLTPLAAGGVADHPDGYVEVGADGRIVRVGDWSERPTQRVAGAADTRATFEPIDLRPLVVLPGMVDIHAHLPQLPSAGLGAGLDLLAWLERYIFPLERAFDEDTAQRLAPCSWQAFARAGTTTAVVYGAVYQASVEAMFRTAEQHGLRLILGKVMMDRGSYDTSLPAATILDRSLRESMDLITRWHGRDDGRLQYAVTPRFAVTCTTEMLRESARLA